MFDPHASARRVSALQAHEFILSLRAKIASVALNEEEYDSVLKRARDLDVISRTIHDAVLGKCALKIGADVLLTWNRRDFVRLGDEVAALVRTPQDFLSSLSSADA